MNSQKRKIRIANKLSVPSNTKGVLWDMDGVIIDSFSFDVIIVNKLLRKYFGNSVVVSRRYLKSIFAYDTLTFWEIIFKKIAKGGKVFDEEQLKTIYGEYSNLRQRAVFKPCRGVLKIINDLKQKGIRQVVVSNNSIAEIRRILKNAGVVNKFDSIFGNDTRIKGKLLAQKPSPQIYLFAIKQMDLIPSECVIIEDTEIGVKAGKAAGCFTVGVATGGANKNQLQKMNPRADKIYYSFT